MKHYSEIIKKAVEENNEKCESEKNKPKKKETMNTISYPIAEHESLTMRYHKLKSISIAYNIHEKFGRSYFRISHSLVLLYKVLSKITRFIIFLIRVIYNSIIHR